MKPSQRTHLCRDTLSESDYGSHVRILWIISDNVLVNYSFDYVVAGCLHLQNNITADLTHASIFYLFPCLHLPYSLIDNLHEETNIMKLKQNFMFIDLHETLCCMRTSW